MKGERLDRLASSAAWERRMTTCFLCQRSIHQTGKLWPVRERMACDDCAAAVLRRRARKSPAGAGL